MTSLDRSCVKDFVTSEAVQIRETEFPEVLDCTQLEHGKDSSNSSGSVSPLLPKINHDVPHSKPSNEDGFDKCKDVGCV